MCCSDVTLISLQQTVDSSSVTHPITHPEKGIAVIEYVGEVVKLLIKSFLKCLTWSE